MRKPVSTAIGLATDFSNTDQMSFVQLQDKLLDLFRQYEAGNISGFNLHIQCPGIVK
jgi:hypothetical protein